MMVVISFVSFFAFQGLIIAENRSEKGGEKIGWAASLFSFDSDSPYPSLAFQHLLDVDLLVIAMQISAEICCNPARSLEP